MAFGLSSFKKIKENSKVKLEKKFIQTIIVGDDLASFWTFLELRKTLAPDKLRIILPREVSKQSIQNKFFSQLHQIRSEESVQILQKFLPNLTFHKTEKSPVFYKDTEFKEFASKTRPATPLLGVESFYTNEYYSFPLEELLRSLGIAVEDWENLDCLLEKYRDDKEITYIEKTKPVDLIDKANWTLMCKDDLCFECENLIWSKESKLFLSLLKNKEELPEDVMQAFDEIQYYPGFLVSFENEGEVFSGEQTVFLPQSLTHEWGYFIGEFFEYDSNSNKQNFTFSGQIHEEDFNAEELAKKIKLLKRTLKRIFTNFNESKESIYFSEGMFVGQIQDKKFSREVKNHFPSLFFIGQTAPLFYLKQEVQNLDSLSYITRSLLSFYELKQSQL